MAFFFALFFLAGNADKNSGAFVLTRLLIYRL